MNEQSQILINAERLEGESFEQYKQRQKLVKKAIKQYKRGKYFWDSIVYKKDGLVDTEKTMGTYKRVNKSKQKDLIMN